jgi:hypothetical protein
MVLSRRIRNGIMRATESLRGVRLSLVPGPESRERLLQGVRDQVEGLSIAGDTETSGTSGQEAASANESLGCGSSGRCTMSAALQLSWIAGSDSSFHDLRACRAEGGRQPAHCRDDPAETGGASTPSISLAFYRKHTERMLRRYLYASMQVGRAPSILGDPVGR